MEKRHNYVRKVAEVAVQLYITNDKPNISGSKNLTFRICVKIAIPMDRKPLSNVDIGFEDLFALFCNQVSPRLKLIFISLFNTFFFAPIKVTLLPVFNS